MDRLFHKRLKDWVFPDRVKMVKVVCVEVWKTIDLDWIKMRIREFDWILILNLIGLEVKFCIVIGCLKRGDIQLDGSPSRVFPTIFRLEFKATRIHPMNIFHDID
mmetsp:Transcript_11396/g.20610  ORF Transcript_11396/g.20610 Transcript_11396/m.20610 type:complete len:105 (+) Transcript_11396:1694-2008(+)